MDLFSLQPETRILTWRKNAFAFIAISILILSIYSNTYNASWHFDDEPNILDRKALHLKELSWSEVKKTFFWGNRLYRPVSYLSFALNYYFGEKKVFGYHLINIIIHIVSALFLFLFIHHSLNLPIIRQRYKENAYSIALLATIFWACNPIQTQAITYIVQRMASMAGMFYIIAMYLYLRGRTSVQKPSQICLYVLCAIAVLLSFGSKENTIILPVTLLLYEILLIQEVSPWEWIRREKKSLVIIVIVIFAVTLIYLAFSQRGSLLSFMEGYNKYRVFSLKERLLTEPRIIVFYISLLLYPNPNRLCLSHDILLSRSLLNPSTTLIAILMISFLIIGALALSKKRPLLAFCIIFYFLNHLVESSFIPLELIFEHRNYIPSMLFFVPPMIFFLWSLSYFSQKTFMRLVLISFIVLVIVGQGHTTYIRNFIWRTYESIWLDGIEKYPHFFRPYLNLGSYYLKNNMPNKALPVLIKASSARYPINTGDKHLTYYNLGVAYQKTGKNDKAFRCYLEAERIFPYYASTYVNKGVILTEKGHLDEARAEFHKAIKSDKNQPFSYAHLGFLQLIIGETDNAIHNLELALKKGMPDIKIYRHLGHAYRKKDLFRKAFLMFQKYRQLDPHDHIILLYLAELYSTLGMKARMEDSIVQFINSFQGNDLRIKEFIKEISERDVVLDALLPDNITLLTSLAEEFHRRSLRYKALADYCLQ